MSGRVEPGERAGWWRRSLALAIDGLCVAVPSAMAGAALFALTGGFLQWTNPGLVWQRCEQVTEIPDNLDPPPPAHSNAAQVCDIFSIAGRIGRELTVANITRTERSTTSIARSYTLLNGGEPGGYDLSWLSLAALLVLLVSCEWRTGLTLGKRLVGVRVANAAAPDERAVPLKRVVTRYAIVVGVYALLFGAIFGLLTLVADRSEEFPPAAIVALLLLTMAMGTWGIWNTAMIVRRYPTVYDAYAGIEVVRSRTRPAVTPLMPAPA